MKLLFVLFNYFPHGGQQRNCLRIAQKCALAGHDISICVRTWEGPRPDGIAVETLGCRGWTNAGRNQNFINDLSDFTNRGAFDGIIAFSKMPGLDLYFASDPCFEAKYRHNKSWLGKLTRRYRLYRGWEEAVFAKGNRTQILLITDREVPLYQEIYGTEPERFHLLPPNIDHRTFSETERGSACLAKRGELGLPAEATLLLMVGSGFRTKGVDRAIEGLAKLQSPEKNEAHLVVIGNGKTEGYLRLAKSLGVSSRVHMLGGRTDVPDWMLATDLLVHPARSENTGAVLLEALANGLPLLVSDVCGYAFHIERANAGRLVPSPFDQSQFNRLLQETVYSPDLSQWSSNGLKYAAEEDLYSCHEKARDLIEKYVIARAR
ncbi:MAG: glycosyltransferase family 4 protein [Verrucomicrobiota bacterium]|jgi:UDP-glucose:(heptosyl)LPS alpha-1,3-glucosyltransferase|nr:glycosyltransferase family 4 protein [Verrucomicrobiota bacterium]MDP7049786.1 glycosyltransferase family 4 protein [Verrucomicrobiota bacterium]